MKKSLAIILLASQLSLAGSYEAKPKHHHHWKRDLVIVASVATTALVIGAIEDQHRGVIPVHYRPIGPLTLREK